MDGRNQASDWWERSLPPLVLGGAEPIFTENLAKIINGSRQSCSGKTPPPLSQHGTPTVALELSTLSLRGGERNGLSFHIPSKIGWAGAKHIRPQKKVCQVPKRKVEAIEPPFWNGPLFLSERTFPGEQSGQHFPARPLSGRYRSACNFTHEFPRFRNVLFPNVRKSALKAPWVFTQHKPPTPRSG